MASGVEAGSGLFLCCISVASFANHPLHPSPVSSVVEMGSARCQWTLVSDCAGLRRSAAR